MLSLVRLRTVNPSLFAPIQVAGAEHTDLYWAHAREPLQADHIGYDFWEVPQGCLNFDIIDGHDRVRLTGFRSALAEPSNSL